MTSADDSLFDVAEAAAYLKVKPSTLYGWAHQRRIPFRKHGRRLVFSRSDLEAWSAATRQDPIPERSWTKSSVSPGMSPKETSGPRDR